METVTVAQARRPTRPASTCGCKAGFARGATRKGASASWSSTTARRSPTCRSSPTAELPNYESEIKHLVAGCSVTVEGEVKASPAKGQATEVQAASDQGARLGRSRNLSAAEEAALVRVPADARPPAAAHQHVRRDRPGAQLRLPLDPRFLSGRRLPLRPSADHHGQRLRRRRRDVQGHHARPGQRAATGAGASTTRRTSSIARPI